VPAPDSCISEYSCSKCYPNTFFEFGARLPHGFVAAYYVFVHSDSFYLTGQGWIVDCSVLSTRILSFGRPNSERVTGCPVGEGNYLDILPHGRGSLSCMLGFVVSSFLTLHRPPLDSNRADCTLFV